jgi:hypothetical protein
MRFATPMYDGDSIIRYGPEAQPEAPEAEIKVDFTPKMLHRKTEPHRAEPLVVDTFEIERRARALRAAAMRPAWASFRSWIRRAFESARGRRDEEYLARAQSISELEARLRKLERSGQLVRI